MPDGQHTKSHDYFDSLKVLEWYANKHFVKEIIENNNYGRQIGINLQDEPILLPDTK